MNIQTIRLFSLPIANVVMNGAVSILLEWLRETSRTCRYVVTPNVDHIVKLETSADFRKAYADAALILADGKPVVLASRLIGTPLPCAVTGSDLVPALFDRAVKDQTPLSLFLLGATEGVAVRAAHVIHARWPSVSVLGTYSPPLGFERDALECEKIVTMIAESKADLLLLGLGAPKQELWIQRFASRLPVKVALCVGATIDFLAGEKARAPIWMRKAGLEWLHRMVTEPKRLFRRYAHDALVFPRLLWAEYRKQRL